MPPRNYDLEQRTLAFAQRIRRFVRQLPRRPSNSTDGRQLLRSSGSVGANYIEANDALGRKDFLMRIRIARKEAKESCYWLRLLDVESDGALESERAWLTDEAQQLVRIFSAIVKKVAQPPEVVG